MTENAFLIKNRSMLAGKTMCHVNIVMILVRQAIFKNWLKSLILLPNDWTLTCHFQGWNEKKTGSSFKLSNEPIEQAEQVCKSNCTVINYHARESSNEYDNLTIFSFWTSIERHSETFGVRPIFLVTPLVLKTGLFQSSSCLQDSIDCIQTPLVSDWFNSYPVQVEMLLVTLNDMNVSREVLNFK